MTEIQLRPLERTDRSSARLNAALSIYRETILPEAQNPERQILYWIDHSKDVLADEFRCFAIQRSGAVMGYLQYSYFSEEHIFFLEYLCIRDQKRRGLVPNEALITIEDFLAQNYRPDFTIVFEVAHKRGGSGNWEPDRKLTLYFERLGFRQVQFEYRYPVLQSYEGETSYPADLMIRLPHQRITMTPSELRTVLRCIYFKHYLRWDRPFLEPARFTERERLINELYTKETAAISNGASYGTKGDERRSRLDRFVRQTQLLAPVAVRIFRPKLLRLLILALFLLGAEQVLGSVLLLAPFVLAVAALYCLAEDTQASRKLFVLIMSRLRVSQPRSS